jgi:hypothetical protein
VLAKRLRTRTASQKRDLGFEPPNLNLELPVRGSNRDYDGVVDRIDTASVGWAGVRFAVERSSLRSVWQEFDSRLSDRHCVLFGRSSIRD